MSSVADAVPFSIASALAAFAWLLHWRGWDGRWHIGLRAAALAVVAAATSIVLIVKPWILASDQWASSTVVRILGYYRQGQLVAPARTLVENLPWLVGAGLFVWWLVALLPKTRDQLTWGLVWAGAAIPVLLTFVPGPVGATALSIIQSVTTVVGQFASAAFGSGHSK